MPSQTVIYWYVPLLPSCPSQLPQPELVTKCVEAIGEIDPVQVLIASHGQAPELYKQAVIAVSSKQLCIQDLSMEHLPKPILVDLLGSMTKDLEALWPPMVQEWLANHPEESGDDLWSLVSFKNLPAEQIVRMFDTAIPHRYLVEALQHSYSASKQPPPFTRQQLIFTIPFIDHAKCRSLTQICGGSVWYIGLNTTGEKVGIFLHRDPSESKATVSWTVSLGHGEKYPRDFTKTFNDEYMSWGTTQYVTHKELGGCVQEGKIVVVVTFKNINY